MLHLYKRTWIFRPYSSAAKTEPPGWRSKLDIVLGLQKTTWAHENSLPDSRLLADSGLLVPFSNVASKSHAGPARPAVIEALSKICLLPCER